MHGLVPDYEALRDIYIYLMRAKERVATLRP
jgi:hypothetical protein